MGKADIPAAPIRLPTTFSPNVAKAIAIQKKNYKAFILEKANGLCPKTPAKNAKLQLVYTKGSAEARDDGGKVGGKLDAQRPEDNGRYANQGGNGIGLVTVVKLGSLSGYR